MYRGGRPRALAKAMNSASAWMYAKGWLTGERGATLEVIGRRSGKSVRLPVVVANYEGADYLVSMLGEDANWVRNVRVSGGKATLVLRTAQPVHLVEIPVEQRPPILRHYLKVAPGARPHIPVSWKAPLNEYSRVAASYPVFRINSA
jgi:hypothetical protein